MHSRIVILLASLLTVAAVVTWQATGGDYFTKFETVEEVEVALSKDDPLAKAGFYEGTSQTKVVAKKEFRFGLLPVPQGLFDKHALSVASVTAPTWVIAVGLIWWRRRKAGQST